MKTRLTMSPFERRPNESAKEFGAFTSTPNQGSARRWQRWGKSRGRVRGGSKDGCDLATEPVLSATNWPHSRPKQHKPHNDYE